MTALSVIIVNHNGEKYLKNCLSSVCKETRQSSFEIIMVDNNSQDKSVEIVRREFPNVRIIENRANFGFCKANNQAINMAKGKYVLLLNNDTIVTENALDKMAAFIDNNPKVGAAGPLLLNPDYTPQHQGGMFNKKFWLSSHLTKVKYLIGACLLVRKEVMDKIGGLDENFFFSNDDLDLCRRILKAGWEIYFIPGAKVIHYGGFTTKRFSKKAFVEGFRGGLYFCKKHYGIAAYQAYRILLALAMLAVTPVAALFYPFLKNKGKIGAFSDIFLIALKGDIYPKYEDSAG